MEKQDTPKDDTTMLQLQQRIRDHLSDTATAAGAQENLARMLESLSVPKPNAKTLAHDAVLALQDGSKGLTEIEQGIFDQLNSLTARNGLSAAENFSRALDRRNVMISDQTVYFLKSAPENAVILYMTGHNEPFKPRRQSVSHLQIQGADSVTDSLQTPFHTAVVNNLFHHRSEQEIESTLGFLSKNVNSRLILFENVALGKTPEDIEKEKPLQFMNEYFFKCLLRGPQSDHTNLHASYDTAQGWAERVQKHGWKLVEEESFGVDLHHHLQVFEK